MGSGLRGLFQGVTCTVLLVKLLGRNMRKERNGEFQERILLQLVSLQSSAFPAKKLPLLAEGNIHGYRSECEEWVS